MTSTVTITRPPTCRAAADPIVALRLRELADDLKLPHRPRLEIRDGTGALEIDGLVLRIERSLVAPRKPEDALDLAERVAATLFRQRWHLLRPALEHDGVQAAPLESFAGFGLDLEDLLRLSATEGPDWRVAEICPPHAGLITAESAGAADGSAPLRLRITEEAVDRAQVSLPILEEELDPRLGPGRARLRLRRIRGPVVAFEEPALVAAYVRHASMYVDGSAVVAMLVGASGTPLPEAAEVLTSARPAAIAAGLRRLLGANFVLPGPHHLWPALLATPSRGEGGGGTRLLLLPGHADGGSPERVADRMRAALAPAAVIRWADSQPRSVWRLTEGALGVLDASATARDALSDAVQPCARAGAALLVPDGQGFRIRDMLAECYPMLLVVEQREWPPEVILRERARITLQGEV